MTAVARIRAVDRFIKGLKEDNIYDDLNACCVMAGWDSLAGALTPLKGAAPTNSGFLDADLDRGIGLTGNGSSKYLDSNRAGDDDGQDDYHASVYCTVLPGIASSSAYISCVPPGSVVGATLFSRTSVAPNDNVFRVRSSTNVTTSASDGLIAGTRSSAAEFTYWDGTSEVTQAATSETRPTTDHFVFASAGGASLHSDATLSFYSIGSATDLALLDARVSTLMADLRAIEETGFDRDAIAYIRAVEEADGAYLETDVKVAVNNLVSGLKADGLWDAIGSSCLLSGPRTLAGALVPLRGDAPTPNGFVSGDYSRTDGLRDPGGTSLLDTNRSTTDDPQDDVHLAAYLTALQSSGGGIVAAFDAGPPVVGTQLAMTVAGNFFSRCRTTNDDQANALATGFAGVSRSSSSEYSKRNNSSTATLSEASVAQASANYAVFSNATSGQITTDATIAFYSIGTSLDLAKMDSHITAYVTAIGAAL